MKLLFIIALSLLVLNVYTVTTCVATNFCMGCDKDTADKCTSCFNWGSGSVGAKALNATGNNCQTARTTAQKVTDCTFYDGTLATTATALTSGACLLCGKDFKNWTETGATLACAATAITLTSATCTKIADCSNTACASYTSATHKTGCSSCKKDKGAVTFIDAAVGATTCAGTMSPNNCEFNYLSNTATLCYSCKTGYAVNSADTACAAFTADKNCRQFASGDAVCEQCWQAYYWNATVCKLFAKVVVAGFVSVMAVFLF